MEGRASESPTTGTRESDPAKLISEGCCHVPVNKEPKIAIIGAGPAGLCAARHVFADGSGFTGVVFERLNSVGGTWIYTDETTKDKYGQPVHSPMYYGLETNLPKEVMEYVDFPYENVDKSYLPSGEVVKYLEKYAEHYNLMPHIKLNHLVKTVAPVGKRWSVAAVDQETQIEHVSLYDAVMVCSGPTSIPVYPQIEGLARFSGKQLHAKSFRRGESFEGQRVLVIGLGPSGLDITYKLRPYAKQLVLSHHIQNYGGTVPIPNDVIIKPATVSMLDSSVTFKDGSSVEVDAVIYCTGYTYNFPFLTKDCGIIVVDQHVDPLYHHLFNIENTTMGFLGLPRLVPFQYCVEYQSMAFLAALKGDIVLPSKDEMLKETEEEKLRKIANGARKKDLHKMGPKYCKEYFESLQKLANLPPVPEVIFKMFNDGFMRALKDFDGFRFCKYKKIDNETFEVEYLERPPQIVPASQKAAEKSKEESSIPANPSVIVTTDDGPDENDISTADKTDSAKECEEIDSAQKPSEEYEIKFNDIEEIVTKESKSEEVIQTEETNEHSEKSISTIQTVLATSEELKELMEKFGSNLEKVETTVSETVESSVTRQTIEEITRIDDEGVSVSTVKKETISSSFVQGEVHDIVDKTLNGDQQLSEGIVPQKHLEEDNSSKQR